MDNEKMIENIRTLCKTNNISTTKLEEELGFSQGLISRWKDKTPSIDKIVDIADYFRISLDEVVGRNENNINDKFIKALYDKTINKEIKWTVFDPSVDESGIKHYSENFSYDSFLNEEDYNEFYDTHKEKSYYFEYNHGYISIYAVYKYHNITDPFEIKLFIQPDIQAELIEQPYNKSELLSLWLKILTTLNDNAPDEIKAEDFKNNFINNTESSLSLLDKLSDKQIQHVVEDFIVYTPEIQVIFEIINNPSFKAMQKAFETPGFQETVNLANRLNKYYLSLQKQVNPPIIKRIKVDNTDLDVNTILYVEQIERKCVIYFEDGGKLPTQKPLSKFQEMLKNFGFVRPNTNTLVNPDKIKQIDRQILILINDYSIPIMDRYLDKVKNTLKNNL